MNRDVIDVYAHWVPFDAPCLIGQLYFSESTRGGVFSFTYDPTFLNSPHRVQIDPMLTLTRGNLYNDRADRGFRAFLDSAPDRWGRVLMQRRAAIEHRQGLRSSAQLTELDYLLGVHDACRMGGMRFKRATHTESDDTAFLDNSIAYAAPPMTSLRELAQAAREVEQGEHLDSDAYSHWLSLLLAPGSSLGGARPKASVMDTHNQLWIAKFPSHHDTTDVGAWEMVCHELALAAGVTMAPSHIQQFGREHHTFLTKRFDRLGSQRIHFSSAMTQLQYYDGEASQGASYLEIAEFLQTEGANTAVDLAQLWRRIVFHIAISNTDDHLRNHGFLLTPEGWRLSPAFDLNPTVGQGGLHLNITDLDNALDYQLAFAVREFFRLTENEATAIYDQVLRAVSQWSEVATRIGLSRHEQAAKAAAFNV